MSIFAFIDTNVWVHFRPIEDIDWLAIIGAESMEVVVLPALIDELDKLKDAGRTRRIKDRARRALQQIEAWDLSGGATLRPSVTARCWSPLTPIDVRSFNLDPQRSDDVLLAQAKSFLQGEGAARGIVITADTGPRLKARRIGLECCAPPEDARIAEADPLEEQNRRLHEQVNRLSARLPDLAVTILDGVDNGKRLEVTKPTQSGTSRDVAIQAATSSAEALAPVVQIPPETEIHPTPGVRQGDDGRLVIDLDALETAPDTDHLIPRREYERYASERLKFLQETATVAARRWDLEHMRARTIQVTFLLVNRGTSVAEDTDVRLLIPDGPQVWEYEPLTLPELPTPPKAPRSYRELWTEPIRFAHLDPSLLMPRMGDFGRMPQLPNVTSPRIRRSNSYEVAYHIRRLKHHERAELGSLALVFDSSEAISSLGIRWSVRSASLPDVVEGILNIIVR